MSITPGQISATNVNIKKMDKVLINDANISYVNSWTDLSAFEPATVGRKVIIRGGVQGAENFGDCIAIRYDQWGVPSSDAVARAYVSNHPIPAPEYGSLFRSHIYLAPSAGAMDEQELVGSVATSQVVKQVSKAPFGWLTVRLFMSDITGAPLTPEGIWFGTQDVGGEDPRWIDNWVAATGVVAAPAGSLASPGVGPVCDFVSLPGLTTTEGLVVRIQMPAGTITKGFYGSNAEQIPDFLSIYTRKKDGTISADPGVTTDWQDAYGEAPWWVLQVAGLSVPQCLLGGIGDSHMQGYLAEYGGAATRGMLGELASLQTDENLCVTNLAHTGDSMSLIASKLRIFEEVFDFGGWIRQRASVNDRTETWDYTTAQADDSFAQLQADSLYLANRSKIMIPQEGAGANDGESGWYTRFNTHRATEMTMWPAHMYDIAAICNSDGSFKTDMVGPDEGHPSVLGNQTWAVPSWSSLQSALTSFGVSI
jgi:hypothetical protein